MPLSERLPAEANIFSKPLSGVSYDDVKGCYLIGSVVDCGLTGGSGIFALLCATGVILLGKRLQMLIHVKRIYHATSH